MSAKSSIVRRLTGPTNNAPCDAIRLRGGERYAAWLGAGYREHYSRTQQELGGTPYLLQKCVRGDGGAKLYSINVFVWDWTPFPAMSGCPVSFAPEVQFNTHSGQRTFNVELLWADDGPAEVEAFFRRIYEAMGCEPYEPAEAES